MKNGHPSTRAVSSGTGNQALAGAVKTWNCTLQPLKISASLSESLLSLNGNSIKLRVKLKIVSKAHDSLIC